MNIAIPKVEMQLISALRPYAGNARTHSKKQIRQIAESISRFGFTNPVLVSDTGEIIAGHGRLLAANELGIAAVPTLRLSHLSAEERRAYVLADNKLALNAGWDTEILAIELQALIDIEFEDFGAMYQEVQVGNLDVDAMARGEFDDAALDFMERRGLH